LFFQVGNLDRLFVDLLVGGLERKLYLFQFANLIAKCIFDFIRRPSNGLTKLLKHIFLLSLRLLLNGLDLRRDHRQRSRLLLTRNLRISNLLCHLDLHRQNHGRTGEGFRAVLALERDTLHDRPFVHVLTEIKLARGDFLALFCI